MPLLIAFCFCLAVMMALWLWQRRSGRADWVDAAWAALIGLQALAWAVVGDGALEKRILLVLLAGTWSFRLTAHLVTRLAGESVEDGRYRAMREHFGHRQQSFFFLFFVVQAVVAWLFALPAWVVAHDPSPVLSGWVIAGVVVWFAGLGGESIADRQLAAFKADPDNRGKVCNVGLWRYSRHPNYFFEWLHWFSYPLVAIGAPNAWLAWLAPVVMLVFLYRLSGIPYTERQALKSRGEAYREYQRTTSAFFPWPRKKAGKGER
jgi:steroid 5-alpha reductase family enzyme